jgi:hypothetical protein
MRILQTQEAVELLSYFPKTRLSYEVNVHKKDETYDDRCFIIPKGKRCVAWATEWKRQKIIAIIDIVPSNPKTAPNRTQSNYQYQSTSTSSYTKFIQENGWTPGQVTIYDVCFNGSLSYGTVFGGTIFKTSKQASVEAATGRSQFSCFCIQNIYWYKGNPNPSLYLDNYVKMCEQLFVDRDILQVSYTSSGLIFGLPILCNSENDAHSTIPSLPYQVYSIHFRSNASPRVHQMVTTPKLHNPLQDTTATTTTTAIPTYKQTTPISNSMCHMSKARPQPLQQPKILPRIPFVKPHDDMLTNIQAVFIVRPHVQNDIYELYVRSPKLSLAATAASSPDYVFHNFAHIPNYKTSVMMNTLFRNIKENVRLDTMEESDDEEEFENIEQDKFVSLKTEYKMICRLNKKFCKWVPIQIVSAEGLSSSSSSSSSSSQPQDIIMETHVKQHELRYLPKKYVQRKQ